MTTICPQCMKEVNESTNRLIQDACGHKKCRICLLQDETCCKICDDISSAQTKTITTINNIEKSNSTNESVTEQKNDEENLEHEFHNKIPHIIILSRSPVTYKCTICLKTFSTNTSAKYHFYCDGTEKPLKCDICNKGFISKSHLDTHRLKHSGVRPFTCTKCSKSFTQKSKLNRHLKLHTGERPYICTECGKSFTNNYALTGHLRLHSGEQPYACQQCGIRFNNKSNLSKHEATHTKVKSFMCEECGKKFSNKWALVAHGKNHKSEKIHPCDKCTKSFAKLKDLKRHKLIHLDIKPFCCKLCHMKFCRKDNLERHLKNTHSIKNIQDIKTSINKIIDKPLNVVTSSNMETDIKTKSTETTTNSNLYQDNPNAINVIKMSNQIPTTASKPPVEIPIIRNAVPVINGPFKLAFKTDAFKNNYNILKRENIEELPPTIQTMKPYDLRESLNICHKILAPMNTPQLNSTNATESSPTKNVIMSVGNVNEKDSLEICKKILTPDTPLHYETSFEHEKHAVIKNIKFKLPSTYTNAIKSKFDTHETETKTKEYTDLQPVKFDYQDNEQLKNYKQSVIVNHISSEHFQKEVPFSDMHWRRRTAQNLQPKNQ